VSVVFLISSLCFLNVNAEEESIDQAKFSPVMMADALHLVIEANRRVYAKTIVDRLSNKHEIIGTSEHFLDERNLALPAQLFRLGAESVDETVKQQDKLKFSYSLKSLWPIRKKNGAQGQIEKDGLEYVSEYPEEPFYANDISGGDKELVAVYADIARSESCVDCHNTHKLSTVRNFTLGDVLGGIVIRINY